MLFSFNLVGKQQSKWLLASSHERIFVILYREGPCLIMIYFVLNIRHFICAYYKRIFTWTEILTLLLAKSKPTPSKQTCNKPPSPVSKSWTSGLKGEKRQDLSIKGIWCI